MFDSPLLCSSALAVLLSATSMTAGAETPSAAPPPGEKGSPVRTDAALTIDWTGPPACGAPGALERETKLLLGAAAESAGVRVVARAVQLADERYRIDLTFSGKIVGTRSLESADCREAVQASAVVLALAVNPDALLNPRDEPPRRTPPASTRQAEASPAHPEPAGPTWTLGLSGKLSAGTMPSPAWGMKLGLGAEWHWLRLEAAGFVDPASSLRVDPTGLVAFQAGGGELGLCARFLSSTRLSAGACSGVTVTDLRARASNLEEATTQKALIVSGNLGLTFELALQERLSAVLASAGSAPTTRPRFTIRRNDGTTHVAHEVSPGGQGSLGLRFRF